MIRKVIYAISFISIVISISFAEDTSTANSFALQPSQRPLPVYVSELSNINDYEGFANGGWDGNWYPGFNVCWIEKLPPPALADYRKAFIGVKLGRTKTRSAPGKSVWEKEPITGDIYVSLSSTPAWKGNQKYFLVSSADIPLEADPENVVNGVGESRWFWTEVPISRIDIENPQFIALWSPSEYFVSTASSPILAGGWGSQEVNSWMNSDIKGYAPINPSDSLKTPISVFEPAIAMKFIPQGTEQDILVSIASITGGRKKTADKTIIAAISGENVDRAWLEVSTDGKTWVKHSRYIYGVPYMFTLKADKLPAGKISIRCAASDEWGNLGYSSAIDMAVTK